jgi:hypothetical protein
MASMNIRQPWPEILESKDLCNAAGLTNRKNLDTQGARHKGNHRALTWMHSLDINRQIHQICKKLEDVHHSKARHHDVRA